MAPSRLAQLKKLLAADPADPFILYGIAQEHAKAGDHDTAVSFYDRCAAADPNYCYAYYHKAMSLIELGRSADAVATCRTGIERAKAARDGKAQSELASLLDSIT